MSTSTTSLRGLRGLNNLFLEVSGSKNNQTPMDSFALSLAIHHQLFNEHLSNQRVSVGDIKMEDISVLKDIP